MEDKLEHEIDGLVSYCLDEWVTDSDKISKIKDFIKKQETDKFVEIPKDVAEQIERIKSTNGSFATLGLFDGNYKNKPHYAKWIQFHLNKFMVACTIGYTVKEEKRYYLKNILTDSYLTRDESTSKYFHLPYVATDYEAYTCEFTENEVHELAKGAYEKIEVKD